MFLLHYRTQQATTQTKLKCFKYLLSVLDTDKLLFKIKQDHGSYGELLTWNNIFPIRYRTLLGHFLENGKCHNFPESLDLVKLLVENGASVNKIMVDNERTSTVEPLGKIFA